MKSFVAAVALAAGVSASYSAAPAGNVTYTTEVVTAYTTYCPAATTMTYGTDTYTVTEPTTLTITNCPGGCTISKPVYTTSSVICATCEGSYPTTAPAETSPAAYPTTGYTNGTVAVPTTVATSTGGVYPTGSSSPSSSPIPTAGAGKVAALSGASLAGLLGLAAFL
ncbi:hypothetical protein F5Y15DRAFT_3697 [Xylariaceae sp. FL0016]|nr:hypothetical protein F5Y15DRAFT_3697 [Xylariaceae sp. FL0016]